MNDDLARPDFGFQGFFDLRTPADLMKKLRHDRARLAANPVDSYAAFDFFVTANAMVDWTWPSASRKQQRKNRRADTLPRICEHLADGAKHFLLVAKHQGVDDTRRLLVGSYGQTSYGDAVYGAAGALIVELEPRERRDLGMDSIAALALADLVLEYWSRRVAVI